MMPSVILPADSTLIEMDEAGDLALAEEPLAWCLLSVKSEVYLGIDPDTPTHPYVLSFGSLEEALAFREYFC